MTIEINKDTEKLLSRIEKNAKIIIYGTAEAAIYLKNVIEEKRKDIKLLSFVNTYETGEIDGIPVIKPGSLPEIAKDVDVAIIASVYFADTMKFILLICGIKKYLKITPKILDISFKTKPSNMPDELVRKAQQVFDILDSDKDRDLYKMALDYRTHKDMISLPEYHKKTNKHYVLEYPQKHYFEFIKKSKIKTVLDIGAYDCTHSLLFLAKFPNITKVYAFEPMYDTFKKDFLDELVIANNDEMALGAVSALQSAGYNKGAGSVTIPVFGVDATDAAKAKIADGSMAGTIKQDGEGMAQAIKTIIDNFNAAQPPLTGIDAENTVGTQRVNVPYSAYTGE